MVFKPKVTETVEYEEGDGGLDFSRPVYTSKTRGTVIEGYFLAGHNAATEYGEDDIKVTHSVKGRPQKVISAKKIITKADAKKAGAFYSFYDKFENDILADEMEASKLASADGKTPSVNLRSIEVFVPFFCTYASINKALKDENGKLTGKIEKLEYTPNAPIVVGMGVGDLYFDSAASGVGRVLNKAFENGDLEDNKMKFVYGDIDAVRVNKKVFALASDTKDIQKEVNNLRKDPNILQNMFADLLPIPYSQWYEETQGKRYYTNAEKKRAKEDGVTLDYSLPEKVEEKSESVPF